MRIQYFQNKNTSEVEKDLSLELKALLKNAVQARKEKNSEKALLLLESLNGERIKYPAISRELMRNYLLP